MSLLGQAADHIDHLALDATAVPWAALHYGSRTGFSYIHDSINGREIGQAGADDVDLAVTAVNSLPALVNLLRVIEKDVGTSSLAYKAAEQLAKMILGQD